jgi:hypothetical protein
MVFSQPMGENTIKGATQVRVHTPQNYIFVCLKDHKGNIIVWIKIKQIGIFSINYKVYMFNA